MCEFVYQGKRFYESTGATSKTVAREYEKRRKAELEREAAGFHNLDARLVVTDIVCNSAVTGFVNSVNTVGAVLCDVDECGDRVSGNSSYGRARPKAVPAWPCSSANGPVSQEPQQPSRAAILPSLFLRATDSAGTINTLARSTVLQSQLGIAIFSEGDSRTAGRNPKARF